ncbi:response regulator [Olivibacter ginsenosidimutans]|uniref:Response regulator n=1 Tax=Olivibacter ginsenosidimutans TaxID=1176537 RepID=A0ABP9ADJ9_9SPHI
MKPTIVICDDDQAILEMLEMVLDDGTKNIILVSNSTDIFNVLAYSRPCAVLLDLWMPILSGDQILKKLRATKEYAQLPIIVISASREGESVAREAGATAFLAKPFDISQLCETVEAYITS